MLPKGYGNQRFQLGNAQLLGNCAHQNDYFSIEENEKQLFIVIADGLTDRPEGKRASVMAVEAMKYHYHHIAMYQGMEDYFKQSFGDIEYGIHKSSAANKTGAAVFCSILVGKALYWAAIGSCGFYLYRKGEIRLVNGRGETNNRMEYGTLQCKKRDVLLFCTEGVFQCVSELELKEILSKEKHPYEKAMDLINRIGHKGYAYQKNATAIIVEI